MDRNLVKFRNGHVSVAVALLAEGVDRNTPSRWRRTAADVALLAEGVDRNESHTSKILLSLRVALLAEGVDRNIIESFWGRSPLGRPPRGGRG